MSNFKRLVAIIAITFCALATRSFVRADDAKPEMEAVADKEHHYQISVPAKWAKGTPDSASMILKRQDATGDNMNIVFVAGVGKVDLDDVVTATKAQYPKMLQNWKLLEEAKCTAGGLPARRLVMTGSANGQTIELIQIITISKGGDLYVYSAGSLDTRFADLRPTIDAMIDSIKFLED